MKYLRMIPLLAILTLAVVPAATAQAVNLPSVGVSHSGSFNWSGYAVNITGVTSVTGTFTIPIVSGPCRVSGLPTDVSFWVGIDGYSSGTVEQTGVSGDCNKSGAVTYYAWWEMYPRSSTTIKSMTVSPGDSITATVTYNGRGSFTISIADSSNGQSFAITAHAPAGGPGVAQRSSAEWVVERAATIYKGYLTILPLATFEPATFTSASFTVDNGPATSLQDAVSTYPGCTGSSPETSCYDQMIMLSFDSNGNLYQIDSTSLVSLSSSFTVTFIDNGLPLLLPGYIGHK
jgi:Peptidase A4 family